MAIYIIIFIIYAILTGFGMYGFRNNGIADIFICLCVGWLVFPLIVMLGFGKYLNRYF